MHIYDIYDHRFKNAMPTFRTADFPVGCEKVEYPGRSTPNIINETALEGSSRSKVLGHTSSGPQFVVPECSTG